MAESTIDERVAQLQGELARFSRIADHLGVDVVRPVRAFSDGYPENTVLLVAKIAERILKELWIAGGVEGDPSNRSMNELVKATKDSIHSGAVVDALRDIQQRRNKSSHDGYEVADEDALFVLRRLVVILEWFTSISPALQDGPALEPQVEAQVSFLTGLYLTLGYRVLKRFDLSRHTAYQLFERARGVRVDYVEILLSSRTSELLAAIEQTDGEFLTTTLRKRTRFVVVDADPGAIPDDVARQSRVVTFDHFLDSVVDSEALRDAAASRLPRTAIEGLLQVGAELLQINAKTLRFQIDEQRDPTVAVSAQVASGGNLLIIGPAGSGKSTLLRLVAAGELAPGGPRYRFLIDMGLRSTGESFSDVVCAQLAHAFRVERHEVYETFLYLIRSGKAVCLIDAVDEGAAAPGLESLIQLFAEISETLSTQSTTILASRASFLVESPYVRQLLNRGALSSDLLVKGLSQEGVDPLELPEFAVLKIGPRAVQGDRDDSDLLLLERSLLPAVAAVSGASRVDSSSPGLLRLVLGIVDADTASCPEARLDQVDEVLGKLALERRPTMAITDVYNAFGLGAFDNGILAIDHLRPQRMFETVDREHLRFRHRVIGEAIAARLVARRHVTAEGQDLRQRPISDQTRRFLVEIMDEPGRFGLDRRAKTARECVVGPGLYVVGPPDNSWLHWQSTAFEMDQTQVTVADYLGFLDAVEAGEAATMQATGCPSGHDLQPFWDRVRVRGYYARSEYHHFPAMCIDWWSADAFARWTGKRLPTSIEWELAARGNDGRLFPWGDEATLRLANSADHSCGRLLVSYEEWKTEFDAGRLREGLPMSVGSFPTGASPCGALDMAGNVWEWTSTTLDQPDGASAVIAGGSFDNPLAALRCFSRGLYHLAGRSNAVGFRCVRDLDG